MKGKTILVVDDQKGVRKLLSELLSREGYAVQLATNGAEALESVHNQVPDLILLDNRMPGLCGLSTLRQLQQDGVGVPVIFMTAYGDLELVQEAFDLGAVQHMSKPFDMKGLLETIRGLIP